MLNGRVITVYLIFVIVTAAIPYAVVHDWRVAAGGALIGIICWIIGAIWGDGILLKTLRAEPLNDAKHPEIAKLVKSLSAGPGLGHPQMWQVNDLGAMVLTIGMNRKNSNIIFTTGYFTKLEDKVQTGLAIREVTSIREHLTSADTALAYLLWLILLPGRIVNTLAGKKYGEPSIPAMIVNITPALIFGWPIGLLGSNKILVNKVDASTLKNLENPDYLPYGLMKLQESILSSPFDCDLALSGCCIINPNNRDALQAMFKLHPATPKRIDRLRIRAKASRRVLNR